MIDPPATLWDCWRVIFFKGAEARRTASAEAKERLRAWNESNPEWPISIKQSQVLRELQNRRKTTVEIAQKTAPKELRKAMGE